MTGVLEIFLQRPPIALLLHGISHVAHCVYILTKALLLFILLLRMAYVELMVGEVEACTCVTYIAKSNKGSVGDTTFRPVTEDARRQEVKDSKADANSKHGGGSSSLVFG